MPFIHTFQTDTIICNLKEVEFVPSLGVESGLLVLQSTLGYANLHMILQKWQQVPREWSPALRTKFFKSLWALDTSLFQDVCSWMMKVEDTISVDNRNQTTETLEFIGDPTGTTTFTG